MEENKELFEEMKKDLVAAKFLATREEEDKKRALRSLKKKQVGEQLSSLMESTLAKKCEDPGMFSIPINYQYFV